MFVHDHMNDGENVAAGCCSEKPLWETLMCVCVCVWGGVCLLERVQIEERNQWTKCFCVSVYI